MKSDLVFQKYAIHICLVLAMQWKDIFGITFRHYWGMSTVNYMLVALIKFMFFIHQLSLRFRIVCLKSNQIIVKII